MPIYETKKVVIDENDNIINVGELEEMQPNWRVIEMEMKYTPEHGWRPAEWQPPLSEVDKLKIIQAEQFETILMLMGGM